MAIPAQKPISKAHPAFIVNCDRALLVLQSSIKEITGVVMKMARKNNESEERDLRTVMAQRTSTDSKDWFLTFRAREAIEIVCDTLKQQYGRGFAMLQPFTCSTVPEAVIAGGLTPFYADISTEDLSIDPEAAGRALEDHSDIRAVVVQHTYGIINNENVIRLKDTVTSHHKVSEDIEKDTAHRPLLIEDCAHCAGRMSIDAGGKPLADISVHSFGVEKMLPTCFGAAVWIDPELGRIFPELYSRLTDCLGSLPETDQRVAKSVSAYRTRIRVLNHLPSRIRKPLRNRWLDRQAFIPAVAPAELAGHTVLKPSRPSASVTDRVLAAFDDLDDNEQIRMDAASLYSDFFTHHSDEFPGTFVPEKALSCGQPLLWFPVITGSSVQAERCVRALSDSGIYSSTWGRPLLFPGVTDPEIFRLEEAEKSCPAACNCSERILLLPTGKDEEAVRDICSTVSVILSEPVDFIPVLLGTETNVYNMSRAFFEKYGVRSHAYGRYPLAQTAYSDFITVHSDPDFTDPETFVRILNHDASLFTGSRAILLSCGDSYTRLLAVVKDRLDPVYIPVCPEYEDVDAMNSKVRLYSYCEQAGIPYPATVLIEGPDIPDLPFGLPLVLKPDDADDYYAHPFEGQKKAFIINEYPELLQAAADTYAAGYSGTMIIQEFIPGGDDNMRVVNGYKRTDGSLALLSMGQPILEDYFPMAIGNYNVILTGGDDAVYDKVESLLKAVPYVGYFNLDLKYDPRDGEFKVFDFNPRMGRSSYYVTLAGHNLGECVVNDVIYHDDSETVRSYDEYLWADIPYHLIRKYVTDPSAKKRALDLIRQGRCGGTFRGAGEKDPRRKLQNLKAELRSIRNYHKYFVPKDH